MNMPKSCLDGSPVERRYSWLSRWFSLNQACQLSAIQSIQQEQEVCQITLSLLLWAQAFTEALCCIYDRHHSGANPQPSLWVQPDQFFCLQNCWSVYEKYAMGADELGPLSLSGKTTFGGLSATLVDSLDTLWLVGLHEEFQRCKQLPLATSVLL